MEAAPFGVGVRCAPDETLTYISLLRDVIAHATDKTSKRCGAVLSAYEQSKALRNKSESFFMPADVALDISERLRYHARTENEPHFVANIGFFAVTNITHPVAEYLADADRIEEAVIESRRLNR